MPKKLIYKGRPASETKDFLLDIYLETTRLDQFYINPHANTRALFDPMKVGDLLWGTLPNERRTNKRIFSKMFVTYLDVVTDINLTQKDVIDGLDDTKTNKTASDYWFTKLSFD